MRKIAAAVFILTAAGAYATVDWSVPWRRVTLHATYGGTPLTISASTTPDISRLKSLDVRVGRRRIVCDSRFFSDVPYPHLETLAARFSGEVEDITRAPFYIGLQFGEQPSDLKGQRYSELRISVQGDRCKSREFAVPEADGAMRYQESLP